MAGFVLRYHLTSLLNNKVNQCSRVAFTRARAEACRVDCCKSYRDAEPGYLPCRWFIRRNFRISFGYTTVPRMQTSCEMLTCVRVLCHHTRIQTHVHPLRCSNLRWLHFSSESRELSPCTCSKCDYCR